MTAKDKETRALEKRTDQTLHRFLGDAASPNDRAEEREAALLEIFNQCGLKARGPKRITRAETRF